MAKMTREERKLANNPHLALIRRLEEEGKLKRRGGGEKKEGEKVSTPAGR